MQLMPHIKALLDDLIKMTSNIKVKRMDLANKYEDNNATLRLYQQCLEIIDGKVTFNTYKVYPKNVLSNYGKWSENKENIHYLHKLKPLDGANKLEVKINNGRNILTISTSEVDKNELHRTIGDEWITYKNNGYFTRIVNNVAQIKTFSNQFMKHSKIDDEYETSYSERLPDVTDLDDIRTMKFKKLFVYDDQFKKYVEVRINLLSDYVLASDVDGDITENIDSKGYIYDMTINNGIYEKTPYIVNYYNDHEEIIYDTAYKYEYSEDGEYVLIDGEYILYDPNNEDHTNISRYKRTKIIFDGEKYYHRTKLQIFYNDENYYIQNKYFLKYNSDLSINIPNVDKYTRTNTMHYYLAANGLYSPLYRRSSEGNFVYDNISDSYIEYNPNIHNSDIRYSKVTNENVDVYIEYSDNGLIEKDTKFTINGITLPRYLLDSDYMLQLYFTYGDNTIKIDPTNPDIRQYECKAYIRSEISYITWHKYILKSDTDYIESYLSTDNYTKYSFSKDTSGFYEKITIHFNDDDIDFFVYNPNNISKDNAYVMKEDSDGQFIYINNSIENIYNVFKQKYTNDQVTDYYLHRHNIPEEDREDLCELMKDYTLEQYCPNKDDSSYKVPLYTGETNTYYRELNGLPPINLAGLPKINRAQINPYYEGNNKTPYLYELTDDEISIIEENGILDIYKKTYPTHKYLWYLGENRIDVIEARLAAPYDILCINSTDIAITKEMFIENYKLAKNYIFKRHYRNNMFGRQEYYHAYIGLIICVLALLLTVAKSGDILLQNKYMDAETVDIILKSYGFENTFNSIPLIYRREIAKNIQKLIKNKGIDNIYKIIYDIFNADADIFKYYFVKNSDGNINIYQSPINSDNILNDITNKSNLVDYDYVTSSDKYWGVYDDEDEMKEKIKNMLFNYMNSKYITLNNRFDLTELNFTSSYLINYLLEVSKYNNIDILLNIDELTNDQTLVHLIITLFAIQSKLYNFDGNIPTDLISTALIYKFNLDRNITTDITAEKTGESVGKLRDIIDSYIYNMSPKYRNEAIDNVKSSIADIVLYNRSTFVNDEIEGSIYNNPEHNITSLTSEYLKNIQTDNYLTNPDESSLYDLILNYRENAKNIHDFRCFDELLKCISTSKEVRKLYDLGIPVWEKVYEKKYELGEDEPLVAINGSEKFYYNTSLTLWDKITDDPSKDDTSKKEIIRKKDIIKKIYNPTDKPTEFPNKIYPMRRLSDNSYLYFVVKDGQYKLSKNPIINGEFEYAFGYLSGNTVIYSEDNKSNFIYEKEGNTYIQTDLEFYDLEIYYDHFYNYLNTKDSKVLITNTNNMYLNNNDSFDYIINIGNMTQIDFMKINTPLDEIPNDNNQYLDTYNSITVYSKYDLLEKCDVDEYMSSAVKYYENGITPKDVGTYSTNLDIIYIGNYILDDFIKNNTISTSSNSMYIEIIKNINDGLDATYSLNIYKKTNYALSYEMYLREKAHDIYDYLQFNNLIENENEYRERLSKFSSSIIATIESSIENESLRDKINLSYMDFNNITKYIKLVISIFKSFSIDLASMDTIYDINNSSTNRIKIIDNYYTNELFTQEDTIYLNSIISTNEILSLQDLFKIRDELYIDYYSPLEAKYDTTDINSYHLVNDNSNDEIKKINQFNYNKNLNNLYAKNSDVDESIILEEE